MRLTHLLGAVALLSLLAALFWPVNSSDFIPKGSVCLSQIKNLSLGLILYAGDEDRFPQRDVWMDAASPYVGNAGLFRCPAAPKGAYGYAFDGALSRVLADKLKSPETVPLLYDSTNPIRNASDLVTSLPSPGRHGKSGPRRNMVAYADGHARAVVP